MEGICKLCGASGPLIHSHVLPSFVFRWMKQAGYIRQARAPNRRAQDGEKQYWLCRTCEDLFNSFETPFATYVFHPYDADRAIRVRYGEWMLKFCTSVAWRTLLALKETGSTFANFTESQTLLADDALATWARYLQGRYKHTGRFEVHMITFAEISSADPAALPPNINRYLTRTIDMDAAANNSICFTYSKLGPFAIFGFIESRFPQQWKGTKISDRAGWFQQGSCTVPLQLKDYLADRALRMKTLGEQLSPAQQKKVADGFRADPDRFIQSGLFRAMQRDVEMFGDDAFSRYAVPNEKPQDED